jgi:hypothetical protein
MNALLKIISEETMWTNRGIISAFAWINRLKQRKPVVSEAGVSTEIRMEHFSM